MSFVEHECYCEVDYDDENNNLDGGTITMDYIGDGVWKCPKCGDEDSEHKDDVFKARVELSKKRGFPYAEIIPPYNPKLLSHVPGHNGQDTDEIEKDCLEEFLNDSCYGALRGHKEGTFDMEILFFDSDTGEGDYDVVIEVCKETPVTVTSLDNNKSEGKL